jgi:hypothetical protein
MAAPFGLELNYISDSISALPGTRLGIELFQMSISFS